MAKRVALAAVLFLVLFRAPYSLLGASFSDVKQGDWYYSYVTSLAGVGAISGYPDGTFRPGAVITRVEFAQIVLNTFGSDSVNTAVRAVKRDTVERVNEMNPGFWGNRAIIAANYYKLADFGESATEWGKPITRAEMARIAVLSAELLGKQHLPAEEGIELAIADWGAVVDLDESLQIRQAYSNGILVGMDDIGTYEPNGTATRAESCVIVMRLAVPSLRAEVVIPEPIVYDLTDPNRGDAREGMSLPDGTLLRIGKSGVLGEGQGVALDLGRISSRGREIRENSTSDGQMSGSRLGEPYLKSRLSGEMHWRSDWLKIYYAYPKPAFPGMPGDVSPDGFYSFVDMATGWRFCVSFG